MKSVISEHHLSLMKDNIVNMIENGDHDILTLRIIKERLQYKYKGYDIQKNKTLINQMIRDEYYNFFKKDSKSGIIAGAGKILIINNIDKPVKFKTFDPKFKKEVYKYFKNNTEQIGEEEQINIELDIYDDSWLYFRYDGLDKSDDTDMYDTLNKLMLARQYDQSLRSHFIEFQGEKYYIVVENIWNEGELPTQKPAYHYSYNYSTKTKSSSTSNKSEILSSNGLTETKGKHRIDMEGYIVFGDLNKYNKYNTSNMKYYRDLNDKHKKLFSDMLTQQAKDLDLDFKMDNSGKITYTFFSDLEPNDEVLQDKIHTSMDHIQRVYDDDDWFIDVTIDEATIDGKNRIRNPYDKLNDYP